MGSEHENGENHTATDLFTGRRKFDRQIELLTVAVHTLQRDFSVLDERVRGIQQSAVALTGAIEGLEEEIHKLDKALVTRIATITVAERALWMVMAAVIGVGMKLVG